MRKILLVLIVVAACGEEQDIAQVELTSCEQLRDHMIALRLENAINVDHDAHREVMRSSLGTGFLDECARLPSTNVQCALAATDPAALTACTSNASK